MLAELAAYKGETGGFKVAGMRKELQVWVKRQRAQKKLFDQPGTESNMTRDRIKALGGIGFWAPQAGTGPPKRKKRR